MKNLVTILWTAVVITRWRRAQVALPLIFEAPFRLVMAYVLSAILSYLGRDIEHTRCTGYGETPEDNACYRFLVWFKTLLWVFLALNFVIL